jgi:hypothetical protein
LRPAPLPTYLVAMMVGAFAVAGEVPPPPARHPLPLRIISTQQNKDKLTFALENSKSIVAHLEAISAAPSPIPSWTRSPPPSCPARWKTRAPTFIRTICWCWTTMPPPARSANSAWWWA